MLSLKKPTVLAIIPARGGSKSIPQKNIASVAGKPLIVYTMEAAGQCDALDRVIISTDSPAIADVCRSHCGDIPFLRPQELAQDNTPGIDPVLHALQWLERHEDYVPDAVMLLQPTSPLRTAQDISAALDLWMERQADAVVSVTPVHDHPYWTKRVDADGYLADFLAQKRPSVRRQDLPEAYALNGAIYLVRREVLLAERTLAPKRTLAYVMPHQRSLDIDEPWDLHLVNLILGGEASE